MVLLLLLLLLLSMNSPLFFRTIDCLDDFDVVYVAFSRFVALDR